MKKILLGIATIMLISSCDITVIDERPYDPRDNFLGRFEAEEYSETYDVYSFYNTRISRDVDPYSSVIYMDNFYGLGVEVWAEVIGDRLTIPRQRIGDYIIQGTGRLDYRDVVLSYSVESTYPGDRYLEFLTAVFFRR